MPNDFSLREDFISDIPHISLEENEFLTANFTEKYVLDVISYSRICNTIKFQGPMGSRPAQLYQKF